MWAFILLHCNYNNLLCFLMHYINIQQLKCDLQFNISKSLMEALD